VKPRRHGLAWLALAVGLMLAASPASAGTVPAGSDAPAFDLRVEAGRVSLFIPDPVPLVDVLAALAHAIGAEAVVRRDPGEIGPLAFDGLSPAEALRRLAGRNSLVITYDGGIRRVVLVARGGQPETVTVTATPPEEAAPPPGSPRDRRSIGLRRIVELSYRADDRARSELLALADDPEPAMRRAAISALATLGGPAATAAIDASGLTDADPSVRRQAARSLWRLLGRKAEPRLAAVAAIDPDRGVRTAIAELLRPAP
jgi:hypothetical protein